MSESGLVTCPRCMGAGGSVALVMKVRGGCVPERHECALCGGAGQLSPAQSNDYLERIDAGHALKADRMARRVTLADEAKRLGVSIVELSRRERGES